MREARRYLMHLPRPGRPRPPTRVPLGKGVNKGGRSPQVKPDGCRLVLCLAIVNTTEQLPLHRRHKTRAGGVVIPKDTLHSSHGPGSQKGGEEPQTAGKTTAGQRARPVHQMPARTRQAKQGPLRAVLQQGPRIPSWEKAEAKRAQSAGE